MEYDLFLSHRQATAQDMANAIRLELLQLRPSLRIYLDVEDSSPLSSLEHRVISSKVIVVLITEGIFDRPWCRMEMETALKHNKDIILVHDEKSCPFPSLSTVPDNLHPILHYKAVPYLRQQPFRATSIQEILKKFDHFNAAYTISPLGFWGINGYADSLQSTAFCWRTFYRNDTPHNIMTIEDTEVPLQQTEQKIRPRDLKGVNGFRDGIENTYFCWRWLDRNGTKYRVVTIEDGDDDHQGSDSISPRDLLGTNGYENGIEKYNFCWRWWEINENKYRVLTLE